MSSEAPQSRPASALETAFLEENVRIAAAVSHPPCTALAARAALSVALTRPPGRLRLSDGLVRTHVAPIHTASLPADGVLTALKSDSEERDAFLRATVYTDSDDHAVAVVLSATHALVDGRALARVIDAFCAALTGHTVAELPSPDVADVVGPQLEAALRTLPAAEPQFLSRQIPISLREAIGVGNGDEDIRLDVQAAAISAAREATRSIGATFTGLWAACLAQACGEAYLRRAGAHVDGCYVAVSLLVDVRRFMVDGDNVAQAFGTVVISAHVTRAPLGRGALLSTAAACTSDMRERIARGEAIRSAIAMRDGKFGTEGPATFELSNQGVYETTDGVSVWLTQHSESYDNGLSVLVHREKNGPMRLLASVGTGLDVDEVRVIISRSAELFVNVGGT